MSNLEFQKRKDTLCALPFAGMTISPLGDINLCCNSVNYPLGHISDIEDLTKFYNGRAYSRVRDVIEAGEISKLNSCNWCWGRYKEGYVNTAYHSNHDWMPHFRPHFDSDWRLRKEGKMAPVRMLEYTASNTCNQACSTCTSVFSSKWNTLEGTAFSDTEMSKFTRRRHEPNSLDDADIEKIMKLLPDLAHLSLKGGEPWADKNNLRVLSRLLDVNPYCNLHITSNMSKLNDAAIEIIKRFRDHKGDVYMGASIDAIGKPYEWIRSTPFEKTEQNLQKFFDLSGRRLSVIPCVSLHNFFLLDQILDYFQHKEYLRDLVYSNPAGIYRYYEYHTLPYEYQKRQMEKYLPKFREARVEMAKRKRVLVPALIENFSELPETKLDLENLKLAFSWIDKMDLIRGIKLEDYVPELRQIRKLVRSEKSYTHIFHSLREAAAKMVTGSKFFLFLGL